MPSPESLSPQLSSIESLRSSIPEEHRELFDSLQQDIKDYCEAHGLPAPSLTSREAFITAAQKNRTPPDVLNHIIFLLKRFDYLTEHKKPMPPEQDPAFQEVLEYAEEHYHLKEQYTSQISLLREVGILKDGHIEGIDGERYPVPTIEQIALRLYERRHELAPKHDQGFTKLLLVPFGMSLDTLFHRLEDALLLYKHHHPGFELNIGIPLWVEERSIMVDVMPVFVYYPTSFDQANHQGKTKAQIFEEQSVTPGSFPGWTVHLFQPSRPEYPNFLGIAPIPLVGQGKVRDRDVSPRPDIETGKSSEEYLSLLMKDQENPDSPYYLETGLTPEDWIIAFMTHLQEIGEPMDNDGINFSRTESFSVLTGSFFPSSVYVSVARWNQDRLQVRIGRRSPHRKSKQIGCRTSVMV